MSVFNGVPDRRLNTLLSSECALFGHVGAADELDTKVVTQVSRTFHFVRHNVLHALQVVLVAIHDGVVFTNIELVSHLLTEGLDRALHERLFRVHIEQAVVLSSVPTDIVRALRKLFEYLQFVCGDAESKANLVQR